MSSDISSLRLHVHITTMIDAIASVGGSIDACVIAIDAEGHVFEVLGAGSIIATMATAGDPTDEYVEPAVAILLDRRADLDHLIPEENRANLVRGAEKARAIRALGEKHGRH